MPGGAAPTSQNEEQDAGASSNADKGVDIYSDPYYYMADDKDVRNVRDDFGAGDPMDVDEPATGVGASVEDWGDSLDNLPFQTDKDVGAMSEPDEPAEGPEAVESYGPMKWIPGQEMTWRQCNANMRVYGSKAFQKSMGWRTVKVLDVKIEDHRPTISVELTADVTKAWCFLAKQRVEAEEERERRR
ncbi:hypothetical protein AURDEDRAFT_178655, partial [Auricularia subglabra TFB-10046 SS5]